MAEKLVDTVKEVAGVVIDTGRQTAEVLLHTKDELKRTLKEGAVQIGDKLVRFATPTRKEEAGARKAEVKAKKQRKRAEQVQEEVEAST